QEQIRVPLLIRLPASGGDGGSGTRRAGRRISRQVRTVDLAPTILDLAGIPPEARPPVTDGQSLVEILGGVEGEGGDEERVAYAESINRLTYKVAPEIRDEKDEVLFSLTRPPWKYIHHAREPEASELYHLERDPGEEFDLSEEHPEIVRSLHRELQRRRVLPETLPEETSDPELRERLEALGYVQ
ncbi:MAG: hypothetical protein R3234_13935, partial [Thermoanaerobaculia bacterium]|nr:hypothetical protein [Thermoanaerobaculia bacterium]